MATDSPYVRDISGDEPGGVDPAVLATRETATIDALETIPLPRRRIRAGQPSVVTTENLAAWPDQTLTWRFRYNDHRARWTMECTHATMGTLFDGRATATLGRTYSAYPFLWARFIAPSPDNQPDAVTAGNLGGSVSLAVAPGPAGGSFPPEANLTQPEEDAVLARYANDYPVTREWV